MTFTKEQLIAHIKGRKEFADECASDSTLHPERREYYELSAAGLEIARASLEADPVAWRYRTTDINGNPKPGWSFSEEASLMGLFQPLYTAPPAPVSVPDEVADEDCPAFVKYDITEVDEAWACGFNACRAALLQGKAEPVSQHPELTVWYGSMPESNGKSNWTAILHRKGECLSTGITIDRSEYPERVRYEADRVRHIIGELKEEPDILEYDADAHSGYKKPVRQRDELPDGYVLVPVDMTPEQMRAVQINSELGAYTATNLTGAYSMFREFWDVAIAAAPQQGAE